MPDQRKIRSVLELARYRVGDVAWWVILRPVRATPDIPDDLKWMQQPSIHPKALFYHGPYRDLWPSKAMLPKLQHMDFATVVNLLTSELKVEAFPICDLVHCRDTGEFFYSNEHDEWMPEPFLLDTKIAADREKTRILRLIKRWADGLR
jgi:hypothetical protein